MQSAVLCSINLAQVLSWVLCLLLANLATIGCGNKRAKTPNGPHNSTSAPKLEGQANSNSTPNVVGSSTLQPTSTSVPESKASDKPNKSTSNNAHVKSDVAANKSKSKDVKTGNENNEFDDLTDADVRPSQEGHPFDRKKARFAFWHFFLKRDSDRKRRTKRKRQQQEKKTRKTSEDIKTAAELEEEQKVTYDVTQQEGGTCATAKGTTNLTATQQATCSTFKSIPSHLKTAQKAE